MHVHMWHGLSGSGPGIEADVVAVGFGLKRVIEQFADFVDQREQCGLFGWCGIEPCGHQSTCDDQGVSGRDGKAICEGKREFVSDEP